MSGANVTTWLNSLAGEQWSRIAHTGGGTLPADQPATEWRPGGLLHSKDDPCGAGPLAVTGKGGTT